MARVRCATTLRAGLLLACLPLSACLEMARAPNPADALRAVALYDGAVIVTAPPGYCIDRRSVRRGADGRFALLASCESLTGMPDLAVEPAVMTVSVLPRADRAERPSLDAMSRAFGPDSVRRAEDGDGITLLHVAQGGDAVLNGGDPAHWRAGTVINGHLVGLAAYGPKNGTVAATGGRTLLRDLAAAMHDASPGPESTGPAVGDASARPVQRDSVFAGLFRVSN